MHRFIVPLIADSIDDLILPITYIDYDVIATDGIVHKLELYFDATSEWCIYDVMVCHDSGQSIHVHMCCECVVIL